MLSTGQRFDSVIYFWNEKMGLEENRAFYNLQRIQRIFNIPRHRYAKAFIAASVTSEKIVIVVHTSEEPAMSCSSIARKIYKILKEA